VTARTLPLLMLLLCGAGWGLTQPLSKIAVSTGHGEFGLVFWQTVFTASILFGLTLARGRGLPLGWRYLWRYGLIGLVGTILPDTILYTSAKHLPAGVLSILISLVPMFSLPLALALGMERPSLLRAAGLLFGALAIVFLVGPKAALPDMSMSFWVVIAALTPLCYALEGIFVGRYGRLDLDAIQLLLGASLVGVGLSLPLALGAGQFVDLATEWHAAEAALLASSVIHAFVYASYVWLIGRAGTVFASQVSYIVTGSGVLWSILLLEEAYSGYVWTALALMMLGLFLVQPLRADPLARRG